MEIPDNFSLVETINKAKNILLVGHINPDGDCFGSCLALKHVIKKLNKEADFVCDSGLTPFYSFLNGFDEVNNPKLSSYDTVFALDCGDIFRLGKYIPVLKKAQQSINIDHHFSNNSFAKINILEKTASSTCEIVANILLKENLMDKTSAEYLFTGLSTDTGHFSHSSTNEKVFLLAAKLLSFGIDNFSIVKNLYRSNTVEKTKLIAKAINCMHFFDKFCIIALKKEDLESCGCTFSDTEGLIDYAINLKSSDAAALITESGENTYKVSFRSKTVSIIPAAEVFGGGGHKHAAGCVVKGAFYSVIDRVKKAISDILE